MFFNDILTYIKDLKENLEHIKLVLELLKEHQLFARMSKCVFSVQQVEYVRYVVSVHGVATDP